jgi:endonuclease/exonuclease/phosphatase family metal-dependent hydrolase
MIRWRPLLLALLLGSCRRDTDPIHHALPLAEHGELRLTVTTFNIREEDSADTGWKSWPNRIGRFVKSVRKMNPDIMGMQEVLHGQAADLRTSLPDYAFEGVGRDDGYRTGEYSAIFYRRDRFEKTGGGTFWLSDHPTVPGSIDWGNAYTRSATWLHLIDRASGRPFYVFNTHWDHKNEESREKAVRLMISRIDARDHPEEPLVMTGDLNAIENNPAVRYLTGSPETLAGKACPPWDHALVDTYMALHPTEKNRQTLHLWSGEFTGSRKIDYIFVSRGATVEAADIQREPTRELQPSDHFPVWAKVLWK